MLVEHSIADIYPTAQAILAGAIGLSVVLAVAGLLWIWIRNL